MSGAEPVPAATLVLFRAVPGAAPQLLMLERAGSMRFAPGALVFPGGRVDPGDLALAGGDEETAARLAAIRETIEECGIAVGLSPPPEVPRLDRMRHGLHEGAAFATLLAEAGCVATPELLVPFARWRPPAGRETRVFDTRFYLAEAPAQAEPRVDGGECVGALWASAADILAEADAGRRHIIFPTRRNLERLAQFASFAEAAADAARHPVRLIQTTLVARSDGAWLTIPEGLGYPVTGERIETVRRG